MPDQDKYGPARLDGSPLGFGRPAVPPPRSGITAASDLTGRSNLMGLMQERPRTPQVPEPQSYDPGLEATKNLLEPLGKAAFTRNPQAIPQAVAANEGVAPSAPQQSYNPGLESFKQLAFTRNPQPIPVSAPVAPQPVNDSTVLQRGPSLKDGANIGAGIDRSRGQAPQPANDLKVLEPGATAVPQQPAQPSLKDGADIGRSRGRELATGAIPVAQQTAAEVAAAAIGGANAGTQGASETGAATAATLAPQIEQPVRGNTRLVPANAGEIPEGAVEILRGPSFGRGDIQRSFATPDKSGRFFESTDPRSSIQQGQIAGATRNPGSVESAQNTALLGQSNPRSAGIVAAQNEGRLDREGKLAVQESRNRGVKNGGSPLPDLATYVVEAMQRSNMSEEEAIRSYYIEYAEATGGGE